MTRWLKAVPFHAVLLAAYPVLALYAANFNTVLFVEVWRALFIALASAAGGLFLLRLARLSWQRAALIVSASAVLFFSYGHVIFALARAGSEGARVIRPEIVTLLWPAAWVLAVWAAVRLRCDLEPVSVFLNAVSVILTGLAVGQVLALSAPAVLRGPARLSKPIDPAAQASEPDKPGPPPDIYYIILDGYSRADRLLEAAGYDNSAFIRSLEEQGFYVAARSTANYSNTTPSLASSLNLDYINDLAQKMPQGSMDYRPLRQLIQKNGLSAFLKKQGYSIVTFETGFNFTEIHTSDYYIALEGGPNYFESLLIENSLSLLWMNGRMSERYSGRIRGAFSRIADLSDIPSPKFVFAHIMAVHPPFVFGPNGEIASRSGSHVELDAGDAADRQREIEGYRGQLQYINRRVLEMVSGIRQNSPVDPVIILQGDHGSGIYMDWQSAERTCFAERMAILNAYYLPGAAGEDLYESISPVNTFRVVLNTCFGSRLPLLEDRSYFSLWESPYDLIDVTGRLAERCAP